MKIYSQSRKSVIVSIIFVFLMQLSGCYSIRINAKTEVNTLNEEKYSYVIHGQKSNFLIENTAISDSALSGKINKIYKGELYNNPKFIHVYLSSDSVIRIERGSILSVPLKEIIKAETVQVKFSFGRTIMIGICVLYGFIVVVILGPVILPF